MSFESYLSDWQESVEATPGKMPMQDSSQSTENRRSEWQDGPEGQNDEFGRALPQYKRGETVVPNEDGDAQAGSMD